MNRVGSQIISVRILIGSNDDLIHKLYVAPLRQVRKDWPVVEIDDANHITCIMKKQFQEEILVSLKTPR